MELFTFACAFLIITFYIQFLDPAALQCCSGHTEADIRQFVTQHLVDIAVGDDSPLNALFEEEFKGDTLSTRMKQIQQQKANEEARRLRDKLRYERKMEEERAKEREILKKRMAAELNKKQQNNKESMSKSHEETSVNSTPKEPTSVYNIANKSEESGGSKISNEPHKDDLPISSSNTVDLENQRSDQSATEKTNDMKDSDVKELKLDIDLQEEIIDDTERLELDADNSPSFPKSSDAIESAVTDASTNFSPNVLIQRQSKGKYIKICSWQGHFMPPGQQKI